MRGWGRQPEAYCHRALLDAVRYLVDNGIKWRAMPADFSLWDRVYAFFRRWRDHGLVTEFHDRLRGQIRMTVGQDAEPTAGVIDSQSVKADAVVGRDSRGFDGGKLVNRRKRHTVVDTLGLLLEVMVTAADIGGCAAAHHRLARIWADGGYTRYLHARDQRTRWWNQCSERPRVGGAGGHALGSLGLWGGRSEDAAEGGERLAGGHAPAARRCRRFLARRPRRLGSGCAARRGRRPWCGRGEIRAKRGRRRGGRRRGGPGRQSRRGGCLTGRR
jgi:transposase